MAKLGETNTQAEMTSATTADARTLLNTLPQYATLAEATAAGVTSGQAFVLTGVALGLETLKLIVIKP